MNPLRFRALSQLYFLKTAHQSENGLFKLSMSACTSIECEQETIWIYVKASAHSVRSCKDRRLGQSHWRCAFSVGDLPQLSQLSPPDSWLGPLWALGDPHFSAWKKWMNCCESTRTEQKWLKHWASYWYWGSLPHSNSEDHEQRHQSTLTLAHVNLFVVPRIPNQKSRSLFARV